MTSGDVTSARAGSFPPSSAADGEPRELELRYRGIIDHLPAVVYVDSVREGEPMIDVSPGVIDLLGIPREAFLSRAYAWSDAIHPDDLERVLAESERSVITGEPFRIEYRVIHPDGRTVWVREDAVLVQDEVGRPLHWIGTMLDVTELMRTQAELHEARSKYGALVEQIPAIVYVDAADEDMSTTYVSPQIHEILGYTAQEYIEDPRLWERILHPDDREDAVATYLRARESGGPFVFEYRLLARDGRTVWFRDSAIVLTDAAGRPESIQGVMLDITDRKLAEEQIAFLAYHDKLTGLPNRTMFDELLDLAIARADRHDLGVAVVILDLDDFKLVNDSLGHDAGDSLLVQLARRLGEATRETDLVARPGSDEFLLLLADLDRTPASPGGHESASVAAESVALRIQEALRRPFTIGETELYVSASLGLSLFPDDASDAATLMKNAETAMFRSKRSGPGGYVLHAKEDADSTIRLSLSTRLRRAVELEQWMLHYQPLIDLRTGQMDGVEALIRWPEPNGGLVPPGDFIPLAEEMGLIVAIGSWVVDEVCRQDRRWREEGLDLNVSFNLSPRELWQHAVADRIVEPIIASGMDPSRVTVEITESMAMTDPDRTLGILHELHARGVKLAIDDFGTGYSSLARLRYLPVNVLKIDRSFVRDLDRDEQNASMVSAMVALAANLGMTALAEGIETEAEWRAVVERGCTRGQGFFFSRPVPAEEIVAIHRRAGLRVVEGGAAG
ncbi:MAG TPA: EAL domain-containing protein [Actinomycetota bacterium]|nr:EAL domain-containing protein [Actinomycetota bacterium]